jgi:hypothetical protein
VIEMEFTGPLEVDRRLPGPRTDGSIALGAEIADAHNSLRAHARLDGQGDATRVSNWDNAETRVSWDFQATRAGDYHVTADVAGNGGGKLALMLDEANVSAEVIDSESASRRTVELGKISISKSGNYTLELKPDKNSWKGFDLYGVALIPSPH